MRAAGGRAAAGRARLWAHRELVEVLIARELKLRYRGTLLGFLWSFLNPAIMMAVYVLLFWVYMRVPVDNYPAFLFAGLLPWLWFSAALNEAAGCIIANGSLVKKVRLPAEIFPLVAVGAHLVHLLLSVPVLLGVLWLLGVPPGWPVLLLPVVLGVQFLLTYGLALAVAALAVRFRDLLHLLPNLVTVWLFLTPVLYPADLVPAALRPLLALNPMAHLARAYQAILFEGAWPPAGGLALALGMAGAAWAGGQALFRGHQDLFATEV